MPGLRDVADVKAKPTWKMEAMNRSQVTRWALFQRQIVRADYHLSDPLFSPFSASPGDPTARFYMEKDKPWRSKLIAHRVRGCFDAALFTIAFAALVIAFVGMVLEGVVPPGTLFTAVIVAPCLLVSLWSMMKAHSWLRWMVRNWNTRTLAPRSRERRQRGRTRGQRPTTAAEGNHRAGAGALGEILRVWFFSQFVRVQIKADYRVGDSIFSSTAMPGLPGGARQYPEEYLSSGRVWRSVMMLLRAGYLTLAVVILWVTAPWNWESGPSGDPVGWFFYGIVVMVSLRVAIPSQSFLRWMILNWNAEKQLPAAR